MEHTNLNYSGIRQYDDLSPLGQSSSRPSVIRLHIYISRAKNIKIDNAKSLAKSWWAKFSLFRNIFLIKI